MAFRTEGEIIFAANASRDLSNLVVDYLTLFKKYAQGMNGVKVPDRPYSVVMLPQNKMGMLRVKLVFEETTSYETPIYEDYSGYEEPEFGSYGDTGRAIHGYETVYTTRTVDKELYLPIKVLLFTKEAMEAEVKGFAEREKKRLRDREIESKIAAHQEAIRKLKDSK